jgi:hypothetical protein
MWAEIWYNACQGDSGMRRKDIVQKDSKNRLPAGTLAKDTLYSREVDERGRIIFTPQIVMPREEYEEKVLTLNNEDRDRFINSLMNPPKRNQAFKKAKEQFIKKHK